MDRKDLEALASTSPEGLTESILERTSGRPCVSALVRLGDYVDGSLGADGLDRDLVKGHLDGCEDCATVAAALGRLSVDLSTFVELRPEPPLVADVMAATVGCERGGRAAWKVACEGAWEEWTRALLGRSRLAWEAGYVGAVILWLVFGASWAPLRAAPSMALAVVQENHVGSAVEAATSRLVGDDGVAIWDRFWSEVARAAAGADSAAPGPPTARD